MSERKCRIFSLQFSFANALDCRASKQKRLVQMSSLGSMDSFPSCAERIRNFKPPENEQMILPIDYSVDDGYGDYEDEWDCEP